MTSTLSPALTASTDGGKPDSPPPGAFVRLSAFDGLFLRSEHLNLMEDYAATLSLAVGAASGPGVVHGFEVTLSGTVLSVSQGLAILADGRPVRSTGVLTVDTSELVSPPGTFLRVGLVWGTWPFGEEPVQGLLCDAGCGCDGASTHTSRQAEGPFITVTPADDVPTFTAPSGALRSWIASWQFREEEKQARRWPATDATLPSRWPPNPEAPIPDTLPLAILIAPADGSPQLVDTWAVRRDRGAPPPTRYWEWRLGMRPRDVFVAQVLQFQAELEDVGRARAGGAAAELQAGLRQLLDMSGAVGSTGPADDVKTKLRDDTIDTLAAVPDLSDSIEKLLAMAGKETGQGGPVFVELPPAGFVQGTGKTPDAVRRLVEDRLGCPGVVDRVCRCAPGDVGRLFEAAQHRDRTRTRLADDFDDAHDLKAIDVFMPSRGGASPYDWVLFTRVEAVECEEEVTAPATDEVEVVHEVPAFEGPPSRSSLGVLQYPESTWAVPDDPRDVFEAVQKIVVVAKGEFTVTAQVTSEERRPLGYLRAALLAGPFAENDPSTPRPVETTVATGGETITIVTQGDAVIPLLAAPRRVVAKAAADKAVPVPAAAPRAAAAPRKAATTKATGAAATTATARASTARKGTTKKATTTKTTTSKATTKRAGASGGTR